MPSLLQVALDTPLHRLFDYRLPDGVGAVPPGSLVEVPFGRTHQVGVTLGQPADSTVGADKLRDVIRVLDDRPALSPDILRLAQFCADYYHYPLGAILLATLPPRLRNATPFVADTPWLIVTEAGRTAQPAARAKAQRALLDALRAAPQSRDTLRAQKQGRHAAALVTAGWAAWSRVPPATSDAPQTTPPPSATAEQQAALDRLLPALTQFGVHLIHGITGSGKTELYLRLIDAVLARDQQTLVL
ncbi:MAG: primosomal protein N', partial [Thiobacillus sp.]|nr:primosomal protein N' [Thiobacillus sp.]